MELRLAHNILLLIINLQILLSTANVLRDNTVVPKVVSGSKPIDTAARKDDKQGMDDLLYTIYHKHYKNDQRRDQAKPPVKKDTQKTLALKELEKTIDNLIVSLSDETSASKLQTKDINKGINDISKLASAAHILLPEDKEKKDATAQVKKSVEEVAQKLDGKNNQESSTSKETEKRIFHDEGTKRSADIDTFEDFKARFYRTFFPEDYKREQGLVFHGKDQGLIHHGDQTSKDPGIVFHGDQKSNDQKLLYHGDQKPKDAPGILFHGDQKSNDQSIVYHGDQKSKDQGILYSGDQKSKDQKLIFHGDQKTEERKSLLGDSQMNKLVQLYEQLKKQTQDQQQKKEAAKAVVSEEKKVSQTHMDTLKKDLVAVFKDMQQAQNLPELQRQQKNDAAVINHQDKTVNNQHDAVTNQHDAIQHGDAAADEQTTKRRLLALVKSLETQLTAKKDVVGKSSSNVVGMERDLESLTAARRRNNQQANNFNEFNEVAKNFVKRSAN